MIRKLQRFFKKKLERMNREERKVKNDAAIKLQQAFRKKGQEKKKLSFVQLAAVELRFQKEELMTELLQSHKEYLAVCSKLSVEETEMLVDLANLDSLTRQELKRAGKELRHRISELKKTLRASEKTSDGSGSSSSQDEFVEVQQGSVMAYKVMVISKGSQKWLNEDFSRNIDALKEELSCSPQSPTLGDHRVLPDEYKGMKVHRLKISAGDRMYYVISEEDHTVKIIFCGNHDNYMRFRDKIKNFKVDGGGAGSEIFHS